MLARQKFNFEAGIKTEKRKQQLSRYGGRE